MSDWGGLGAIVREARSLDAQERDRPEVDCPLCGTPLVLNARQLAACPLGHYDALPDRRRRLA